MSREYFVGKEVFGVGGESCRSACHPAPVVLRRSMEALTGAVGVGAMTAGTGRAVL